MITNPRVWRDGHHPTRLVGRSDELRQLCRAWEPALHVPHRLDDVLVSGPRGIGKSTIARHALDKLAQQGVPTHTSNCLGYSDQAVLAQVLDAHPDTTTPDSDDVDAHLTGLRELGDDAAPLIVVLDEADGLPGGEALRALVRRPTIATVPICHDPDDWLARAPLSVREAYRSGQLQLDRYGVDALVDILEARARRGLVRSAWSQSLLDAVACRSAGRAREAIQTLRYAAEVAGERGRQAVQPVDVEDGHARARDQIRRRKLDSLPYHYQVVYGLLQQARGSIDGGTFHDRYDVVADDVYQGRREQPLSRKGRRNKLAKLREYGLVADAGANRHTEYRARDPDLEPAVDVEGLDGWAWQSL